MLRGFDQFMNIVLDNAVDEKNKTDIGMVVRTAAHEMKIYAVLSLCFSELVAAVHSTCSLYS